MKSFLSISLALGSWAASAAYTELAEDIDTTSDLATAEPLQTALDLSTRWEIESLDPIDIAYSALGWEPEPVDTGRAVELTLTPDGTIEYMSLVKGLADRGTFVWQPADLSRKVYTLKHVVTKGSTIYGDEQLTALFSFENCVMPATEADILLAVMATGHACAFTNDAAHPWQPIGEAGEGIRSEVASQLSFAFAGRGAFSLQYGLGGGVLTVSLDGAPIATYSSATEGWMPVQIVATADGDHLVTVSYEPADEGFAQLKGCFWLESGRDEWFEGLGGARVDLRTGVRDVRRFEDLLPFTYSISNFTGVAGLTDDSFLRVRVVKVTGEGDDFLNWTNEIAGTEKVLRTPEAESTTVWNGSRGIWRADFDILTGTKTNNHETAVFDLRKFGGFMLLVR